MKSNPFLYNLGEDITNSIDKDDSVTKSHRTKKIKSAVFPMMELGGVTLKRIYRFTINRLIPTCQVIGTMQGIKSAPSFLSGKHYCSTLL